VSIEVPVVRPRRRLARHAHGALLLPGLSLSSLPDVAWRTGPWSKSSLGRVPHPRELPSG